MISSIIRQQIIGISKLSLPFIVFYSLVPHQLFSFWGIALGSLVSGIYVSYVSYKTTRTMADGLKHVPSTHHMQLFHNEIIQCGLQPNDICLRYAYADDGIAMTMFNTVAIDPMLWKGIIDDPEFNRAKNIIETHVIPGVPEAKKILQAKINKALSPTVQKFIFKHELGHVFYNYSNKRIVVLGIIGAITACIGLLTAATVITTLGGIGAAVLGIVTAASIDLLLTYSSNLFFKAREEKRADAFAMQFSSKKEIEAAADFFEQYEEYAQEYRKSTLGLMNSMPTTMLTGYISGSIRVNHLRTTIQA
jgi:hypothetical protein